jgi:hypothetical protein
VKGIVTVARALLKLRVGKHFVCKRGRKMVADGWRRKYVSFGRYFQCEDILFMDLILQGIRIEKKQLG